MSNKIFHRGYPDVVNVNELCEMLMIGKNSAYQLLREGKIKSVRIGSKYIIPTCWVEEYLHQNK